MAAAQATVNRTNGRGKSGQRRNGCGTSTRHAMVGAAIAVHNLIRLQPNTGR